MRDVSVIFYCLANKVCPRNGFETDLFERTFSSLDFSIWNAVRPHCIQNMQVESRLFRTMCVQDRQFRTSPKSTFNFGPNALQKKSLILTRRPSKVFLSSNLAENCLS